MGLTRPKYSTIYDTDYKQSVHVATTGSDVGNLFAGNSQPLIVDGVTLAYQNRILVKDQNDATQNGIYWVLSPGTGSNGWWARTHDASQSSYVTSGMTTVVAAGNVNVGREFRLITPDPITLAITSNVGASSLSFINPFNSAQPGGGNAQIQFNQVGVLGGSANLTFDFNANIMYVSGNIVTNHHFPQSNVTYNLGSVSSRWNNAYVSNLDITNSTISTNATGFVFTPSGSSTPVTIAANGAVISTSHLANNITVSSNITVGSSVIINTTNVYVPNLTVTTSTATTSSSTGALVVTGGVGIGGDLRLGGNLYVSNVISQTSQILVVQDPLLYLSSNVVYPYNYDLGIYSHFIGGPANIYAHTGIVRDYNDGYWKFFSNVSEPSGGTVTFDTNTIYDSIKVGNLITTGNIVAGSNSSTHYFSGNVGVGLSNPSSAGGDRNLFLQASGNVSIIKSATSLATSSSQARYDWATGTSNSYAISALNDNAGSPWWQFTVGSAITGTYHDSPIHVWRNTAGTERVRIDTNGNLLVGTASSTAYNNVTIAHTTTSTSATTGALIVAGGAGIGGNINTAGNITATGIVTSSGLTVNGNASAYNLPNTWPLTGVGGTATWMRLGTFTAPQVGSHLFIKVVTAQGYNAAANQIAETYIHFNTSNGSSVDANGFAGAGYYYTTGPYAGVINAVSVVGNAAGVSATAYTVWISIANGMYISAGSFYSVEVAGAGSATPGTWVNSVTTGSSPGSASSTIAALTNAYYLNSTTTINGTTQVNGTLTSSNIVGGTSPNNGSTGALRMYDASGNPNAVYLQAVNSYGNVQYGYLYFNSNGNIQTGGNMVATIFYGKATTAQYADLAENYSSDKKYVPGTVVVFGGSKEVTVSTQSHDPAIAGIVSTNPAYLMNSEAEGVAVALQGRVPTRVKGPVKKGDRLVSSDIKGVAQAMVKALYEPGCIIGKALEDITDDRVHTIEVVVGRV